MLFEIRTNIVIASLYSWLLVYIIQSDSTQSELRSIASDPDDANLINIDSFSNLTEALESLTMSVCNSE